MDVSGLVSRSHLTIANPHFEPWPLCSARETEEGLPAGTTRVCASNWPVGSTLNWNELKKKKRKKKSWFIRKWWLWIERHKPFHIQRWWILPTASFNYNDLASYLLLSAKVECPPALSIIILRITKIIHLLSVKDICEVPASSDEPGRLFLVYALARLASWQTGKQIFQKAITNWIEWSRMKGMNEWVNEWLCRCVTCKLCKNIFQEFQVSITL